MTTYAMTQQPNVRGFARAQKRASAISRVWQVIFLIGVLAAAVVAGAHFLHINTPIWQVSLLDSARRVEQFASALSVISVVLLVGRGLVRGIAGTGRTMPLE